MNRILSSKLFLSAKDLANRCNYMVLLYSKANIGAKMVLGYLVFYN